MQIRRNKIINCIKDETGASLVTTFVLLFIMILGVTGVLYSSLASYKFSNKSVDHNEVYYELDGHTQEIVEKIDKELEKIESFVIEYMQSERYSKLESYKLEYMDDDTQRFFYYRWKNRVFNKSKIRNPVDSMNTDYVQVVDPVKYNEYLNDYYNEAFERLYFNQIYKNKSKFANVGDDFTSTLSITDQIRYDIEVTSEFSKKSELQCNVSRKALG